MGGSKMTKGFAVVIGMTIAYLASFMGMFFAYIYYKKNKRLSKVEKEKNHV